MTSNAYMSRRLGKKMKKEEISNRKNWWENVENHRFYCKIMWF